MKHGHEMQRFLVLNSAYDRASALDLLIEFDGTERCCSLLVQTGMMAEPEVDQHVGSLLIAVRVLNDERIAREEDSVHRLGIGYHLELLDTIDFLLSRAIVGHLRGRC